MPYPHKFIKLAEEERRAIIAESKRLALLGKWKKRWPIDILLLSDQDRTFRYISKWMSRSYSTVRRWIYLYEKDGIKPFISGQK